MDHGYETDEDKRCGAMTKKERQCQLPAVVGIDRCALHAGLARAKRDADYGSAKALTELKLARAQKVAVR